jgi:hypothetical protein
MYKDIDERRVANRAAQKRFKNKGRGITCEKVLPVKGITNEGITGAEVIPEAKGITRPENFGLEDCACLHCRANRANGNKHIINHGAYKNQNQLAANELNRQALPGDVDYTKGF